MHRIFIVIAIEKELKEKIAKCQETLKQSFGKSGERIRWALEKNIHITLIPPWETDNIGELKEKLDKISDSDKFNIRFNKISFGANQHNPQLIWATGVISKPLLNLKDLLEKEFNRPFESRFVPHITIARFNPRYFSSFKIKNIDKKINWRQKVNAIEIFESYPGEEGIKYKIIHKAILK